ncbi:hypothetical protein [Streptoalloteichus hindustanus]|uniref:hypothetical protein n=1 Tax=Streptoalloteichus hindustanus TaxID=2017 RepID=UPI0009365AA4|nr:hypothetical protein [Streptoalloteichus hindustanus]
MSLLVAGCGASDPRKYPPHPEEDVTRGIETLEEALHRYAIDLPCQDGLRWFSDENIIGSGGVLYIRLTPSDACLRSLVSNLGGDPAGERRVRDEGTWSLPQIPLNLDWRFPPDHDLGTYKVPQRMGGARNHVTNTHLIVDHTEVPMTVFLVSRSPDS